MGILCDEVPSKALKPLLEAAGSTKLARQLSVFDFTPRKGETQTEMSLDEITRFKKAENEMSVTYQKVIRRFSSGPEANPALVDRLRKAQRAWIAFRDAHVEAIYPPETPHFSARPMCEAALRTDLTQARTKQLQEWWDGVEPGQIDAGTRPETK